MNLDVSFEPPAEAVLEVLRRPQTAQPPIHLQKDQPNTNANSAILKKTADVPGTIPGTLD